MPQSRNTCIVYLSIVSPTTCTVFHTFSFFQSLWRHPLFVFNAINILHVILGNIFYFFIAYFCWLFVKVKVKSFPSHTAHRAALISVSIALSQTPAYAARPRIRGYCIARCVCLLPSRSRYQFILLGEQRHTCVNNLPKVAPSGGIAGNRTRNLSIMNPTPYRYTTKPQE